MAFLEKEYDRLQTLFGYWGLTQEDVFYAVENDLLPVCVWLPMRYMERGVIQDRRYIFEQHEHKEGLVGVRPEDFRRIVSTGCARLRIFRSVGEKGRILRLAYEPPQSSLSVRIGDLVVLKADRKNFEAVYEIAPEAKVPAQSEQFSAAADYRHIVLTGIEYRLGDVQAAIVQQLHDAAASRNPWMHGKTLLAGANSRAVSLRDVFKSKRDWRKIIASDGRGYYRLNLPVHRRS
jgi:hypothetical protein